MTHPVNQDPYWAQNPTLAAQRIQAILGHAGKTWDPALIASQAQAVANGSINFDTIRSELGQPTSTDIANQQAAPTGGSATPPNPNQAVTDQNNKNALDYLTGILDTYGLGDMAGWAWGEVLAGRTAQQILLDLRQTPQFKAAFPEIDLRAKAGLAPMSPGDIVNYRNGAAQMMREAGLPQGFYDSPSDFTNLIVGNVSLNELSNRVQLARQAVYEIPQQARDYLGQLGLGTGDLTAQFLDPNTAEPLLERKMQAAQIGGQAQTSGWGNLAPDAALGLAAQGITPDQARSGFQTLGMEKQLFSALPNEATTGINQDQQLAAEFGGNAQAQQAIEQQRQRRLSAFSGGGGFTQSASGFAGVGQEQSA